MVLKSAFSGGKCFDYKWLPGLNSSSPAVCQRSDGVGVTGKNVSKMFPHETATTSANRGSSRKDDARQWQPLSCFYYYYYYYFVFCCENTKNVRD